MIAELRRRGCAVSLFSLATGAEVGLDDLRRLEALTERVELAPMELGRARRNMRLAADLARGRAFQTRWFAGPAPLARLREWLAHDQFDVIVAGQLYMLPYVPSPLLSRTLLDTHNVDVHRVAGMAKALWPRPRGIAARMQVGPVRRFEATSVSSVAGVLAVSAEEAAYFDHIAPDRVTIVPNGVDCAALRAREQPPAEPEVLFVGTMTYSANVDAAIGLLRDVAPRMRRRDARITLVGGGAPDSLHVAAAAAGLQVEIAGRVPDTAPWFERSRLLAVPLRFGGGTRLKILEALARGVPVVTTTVGAEGLGLVHERDAIVVDDPAAFAGWVDRLLADGELSAKLARNGRRAAERYDWPRVGEALAGAVGRAAAG